MIKAILFDLDETLIRDEEVSRAAFREAAALAAGGPGANPARLAETAVTAVPDGGVDVVRLAETAGRVARRLWTESPQAEYCNRIGHSAWEGLWARYDTETHPAVESLRYWAPDYRLAVWREALAEQAIQDDDLARRMAGLFFWARRRYPLYPEVPALLESLQQRYWLAIVTNGVADLQREKIVGSGLSEHFQAAVVSGEIDCGKPDPGIFRHICQEMGLSPAECVMVGDNPERDVAGALNAGCKSVWVRRGDRARDPRFPADLECTELAALLPWVASL